MSGWIRPTVLLLLANVHLCRAAEMVFPGREWLSAAPESQHVDAGKLNAAVAFLNESAGSNGVKRMVIVRNGRMIWRGVEADTRQRVWSVTKAFTSTAHGLLLEEGKCTMSTLAKDYRPELSEHYPTVSLRHLATMTSGIDGVGGSYDADSKGRKDANALVAPAPPFFVRVLPFCDGLAGRFLCKYAP